MNAAKHLNAVNGDECSAQAAVGQQKNPAKTQKKSQHHSSIAE